MKLASLNMNLDYIRTFVVTAQSKSMLEASKKMDVTPSYISRHIERLEKALNTKLVISGSKVQDLKLTETGKYFYEKYEKIYNEILLTEKEYLQSEQIEDKFLLSSGNKYQAGSTGGSETHTHNYSHTHQVPGQGHSHGLGSGWAYISLYAKQVFCRKRSGLGTWWDTYQMTGSSYGVSGTGSSNTTATELGGSTDWTTPGEVTTSSQNTSTTSEAQSLPPYLVVYMWRRTA